MANTIVIGMQWGDEGKGAFIDRLAEKHDLIVRYQGGANAGHTVYIGNEKYVLHLLPSGILREDKINVIGNNVLVDPVQVLDEINELRERGIDVNPKKLKISHTAPLILEYNKLLDAAKGSKIGTTGKAIGPTYADKSDRIGLRVYDLYRSDDELKAKLEENLLIKNLNLAFHKSSSISLDKVIEPLLRTRDELEPFVCKDIKNLIYTYNGSILAESAQGTMLDIDHGTYPFVTSSNPTIGGFYTGTGCGGIKFNELIGVLKAYTTRVGEGPFPTELSDERGEKLRAKGNEFGATTGRPRRCGWLDLSIGQHAVQVNGLTSIAITKLDILDGFDKILACIGYKIKGKEVDYFPVEQLENCEPIYQEFPGWKEDTSKAKTISDLPENTRKYIKTIEDYLRIPVKRVGVGKRRDQMIEFGMSIFG